MTLPGFAQQIKLMSYNIGSSDWVGNRDSVIARVEFNDPDVFCAIEATQSTRPYLESSLSGYAILQTFGGSPNLSESHIFYRKGMFTVADSGYSLMPTYVGYTGPARYVNWAQFQHSSSSEKFLVYASHFVYPGGPNTDSATIAQYRHADGMIQLMSQHLPLNIPLITVGDYNADSSKAVMQYLLHQTPITYNSITITNPIDLNDAWYVANPSTQKPPTISAGLGKIDWILTSSGTNVLSASIDDQGVNGSGVYPSDHLPLMITFDFSAVTSTVKIDALAYTRVFPNPFSGLTTITYHIPEAGNVKLTVYNHMGAEITTLVNEAQLEGKHSMEWIAASLAPGIYFCKLKFNSSIIETLKLIVIR